MRSREFQRLKGTAYHEAGHAVALWAQFTKFISITIEPNDGVLGCVRFRRPKWFKPNLESSDWIRLYMELDVIQTFAGQLAEVKFLGTSALWNAP